MDKLLLGLLMLQRLTVYELRNIISKKLWGICSDSTGSIQAAIKKLLVSEMITYSEYVERSVNKKRYSITDKGREEFMQWVQIPADLTGTKNMELGKLLFMGMVPAEKRHELIDEIIAITEKELALHLELQSTIHLHDAKNEFMAYWESDTEYRDGIKNATQNSNDSENINDITYFQMLTLQHSIDFMKFEIEWFKNLRARSH